MSAEKKLKIFSGKISIFSGEERSRAYTFSVQKDLIIVASVYFRKFCARAHARAGDGNKALIKYARVREKENNRLEVCSTPFFSSPKIVRLDTQNSVCLSRARLHLFFFPLIAFLQKFFYLHVPTFNVTMKYHLVKKVCCILKNLKKLKKLNNVF